MYRVVVADERSPRDGRFIEIIGQYQPLNDPSMINIKDERALYWLSQGAQPTESVQKILITAGIWEQFEKSRPKKSQEKAQARKKALDKGQEISRKAHAEKKAANKEDESANEAPSTDEPAAEAETTESE